MEDKKPVNTCKPEVFEFKPEDEGCAIDEFEYDVEKDSDPQLEYGKTRRKCSESPPPKRTFLCPADVEDDGDVDDDCESDDEGCGGGAPGKEAASKGNKGVCSDESGPRKTCTGTERETPCDVTKIIDNLGFDIDEEPCVEDQKSRTPSTDQERENITGVMDEMAMDEDDKANMNPNRDCSTSRVRKKKLDLSKLNIKTK